MRATSIGPSPAKGEESISERIAAISSSDKRTIATVSRGGLVTGLESGPV